jgi:L-cystine uptake protein TcyP (sodium:dicarboxylate symporter family)
MHARKISIFFTKLIRAFIGVFTSYAFDLARGVDQACFEVAGSIHNLYYRLHSFAFAVISPLD